MERRSPVQTRGAKQTAQPKPRFTIQQMLVLAIVTVLSGVALALMVFILLAPPPEKTGMQIVSTPAPAAQETGIGIIATPTIPALPPLAGCAQQAGKLQVASGVHVIDGGALQGTVDGNSLQVRFAGIRVPESGPLNEQAAGQMRALIEGQSVVLLSDPAGQDAAGKDVRYVFFGDHFLNLELVQAGLAQADTEGPNQACTNLFRQGEQQARADRTGVWQPTRVPTATFLPMVTLDPALQPGCDCASRPECSAFSSRSDAQACFNACNDYNSRLDEDHDGLACEELP